MVPQRYRRYWYDGWQAASGLSSFAFALGYSLLFRPAVPSLFRWHPGLTAAIVGAVVGAVLWLPIAYWTWRPRVPTEPGLDPE